MKFYIKSFLLILIIFAGMSSCKKAGSELNYGFSKIYMPQASTQNGATNNDYVVPAGVNSATFNYIIDAANQKIMIRLGAAMSGNSHDGFSVNINVNNDTVQTLLSNGTLDPATNMIMPASMYTIPTSLEVVKGEMNGSFLLTVDADQLKSNEYIGKKLYLWVNISDPSGFSLDTLKSGTLVILNVDDMLNAFQRIYMPQAATEYVVPTGSDPSSYNYTVDYDNNRVNIKLSVETGAVVGGLLNPIANSQPYSVDILANNDTITKMLSDGTLDPATNILMPASMYTLPAKVDVSADRLNGSSFSLSVDISQLKSPEYIDKNLVLAVQLVNPTGYDLNLSLATTIISIDINDLVMGPPNNVSAQYLTNYTSPFESSALQPGQSRWGNLAGWTANAAVLSHGGYGGYGSDGDGKLIDLESGWGSAAIPNGKLYQTITLPAGTYSLNVTWIWASILWSPNSADGSAYVVVSPGSDLPDYNNIEGNSSIFYYKMAGSLSNGSIQKVIFTLDETTKVSLGFVVNYPGTASGQGFKVSSVTLSNYPKSL